MAGSKTYVYCNVLPSGYKSPYLYITDFEVKPGDIVIIPLRDKEKVGLVIDVNTYSDDNAPFPPEQTKHISRFLGDEETSEFQTQKIWIDREKAIRQNINDSLQKQTTKFSLLCNGVEKEKCVKAIVITLIYSKMSVKAIKSQPLSLEIIIAVLNCRMTEKR